MENEEKEQYKIEGKLRIKKKLTISFIIILIISIILLFSLYVAEENFRKWIDVNILKKDITSEDISSIDLDVEKNNQIFCYSKYICILNDKNLVLYNSSGENVSDISVNINTALFASNGKYLAIAEKQGQEFCIISDKSYLWNEKVDGEILEIYINKNGYVGLITTDTTYKSIITIYDPDGKQILKNYLSSTRVTDISISNDNQYLAFAEIDTSGTLIQSKVHIISIEKAKTNAEQALVYLTEASTSKMIIKIQYQENNELICIYDDSIMTIKDNQETELLPVDDSITFMSGNINNSVAYIKEEASGIFQSNSSLNIINTSNKQTYTYEFDELTKEMYTYGNIIGINIGTEIYFINTSANLIKRYTSKQEITNVLLSNNLAIIIYKDKIEIVDL